MGYSGSTFRIGLERGGLVGSKNLDALEAFDMVSGTKNINLNRGTRKKRTGTTKIWGSALTSTPQIMGMKIFKPIGESALVITADKLGKIWSGNSTTIKTGLSTSNFYNFEIFNNTLIASDGESALQVWDGTSAATTGLTATGTPGLASDWTGTNHPQVIIRHGRGVSERLWAFGCPTTPNRLYYSANGTFGFQGDNSIEILTSGQEGIRAAAEFGDRLIVFGTQKAFIIDDTDSDDANWGYSMAQWDGGAAHFRAVCKTPNDLVALSPEGDLYSVTAAETYGDYKSASLFRPADIDIWLEDNADITEIQKWHIHYDPVLRAVRVFFVGTGESTVTGCLLYFIDRPPREGWMLHDNLTNASGLTASCAADYLVASSGTTRFYTGDYNGMAWRIEDGTYNDDGEAYYGGFKTPPMHFGSERTTKKIKRGIVCMDAKGSYNLSCKPTVDGTALTTQTMSMAGSGQIDMPFDVGDRGKRIQLEVFNSGDDQAFELSTILIDYKELGSRQGS
jgi:hypothetical protein